MSARRGFSLAEMVVALLLAGIIGVALARLVISQARFVASQDGMLQARSAARAAVNVMSGELRPVTQGGIFAATADSITIRVPYAFGVACQQSGGGRVISLLPGDSALYGTATATGYAWRDSIWHTVSPVTVGSGSCAAPGKPITTLSAPGWTATSVLVSPDGIPANGDGDLVYLYQRVVYAFAPSATLPGRKALWRRVVSTGVSDELAAPFDTGSGFKFLVGSRLSVRTTPPAILDSIVGVRVRLVGQSERAPEGKSAPSRFDLATNILFRNNAGY